MLKQNESNAQKPEQSSEKHTDKPKNLANNSPTGVKEFDKLLDGGFPKGAVVLLAGSSGSGKTIFAFQWLFEGVKNNENGIYITLTEPLFKILENLEKMNYYDRGAIEQERLKIVDMREHYEKRGFGQKEILNFIGEQVKQINAKRLCIDSITAIAYCLNDKSQIRTFIFELGTVLATLGCTTILTSEVADSDKYSKYEVEEFISDAIIRMDQIKVKDEFQRTMRVVKVRGKSYRAEAIPLKISADGIRIFPKIRAPLKYVSTGEKISTGNLVLDEMLQGGFIQGSTTLAAGSTGTGKTLLCMQFIMDGLKRGEPCLYAGFEESKEQLTRNAKSFGWNLEEYEKKGLLTIRSVYPNDKFLEEHLKDIKQVVDDNNIKRCVIDSLSSISHAFDEEAFSSFAIRLSGYLKAHDVTTFFTAATSSLIGSTALAENNRIALSCCDMLRCRENSSR
jgi:circadian clock protein KaiC